MNRRLACAFALFVFSACSVFAQDAGLQQAAPAAPVRVAPPPENATAEELCEKADLLRSEKNYLDAIDYYRAALKKQSKPDTAVTWNKIGMSELLMIRLKPAAKDFEKSIKIDKTYADARNNLGVVYYMQKRYSKAIKNYRQAVALRESASFHANLGAAYFSNKDVPRAVAEYARALELDPDVLERSSTTGIAAQLSSPADRAHFFYVLARMYARTGDFSRSLECLRKSMEEGYKEIGDVYKDQEFAALRKDPRFNQLMSSKPVAIPQ